MADSSSNQNRYTPPNQRKASGNRRKSGDRTSSQQNNDNERNQPPATGLQMENIPQTQRIITIKDCSRSAAYQLMSQRWAAEMHQYDDPTVDLSVRPIMYYGGSVWGKLPHQILAAANKTLPPPSPTDYMTEVRRGLLMPKANN
ncbi:hypothetical protein AtNW77_Chr3g0163181 [Arabidopsis thaliana]|uniref:Uncharacterized protein n=4 Tax=Arabidopsis TaxID=3701 RepID=A0A178V9Y8_ARATH|nr:hypothetical protein ISN45_At03g007560 [Arabidopsis thaliana x Arabidopsis arenosa]KAG7630431.1 hypothetical protein ISN44_As03g007660 [Arabidopsis suecica]OAP01793.1 hypothetical protein AXX17_AT3G07580 [Arabidopsis thaliana]CAA0381686.1 unnamed protein product [Arabidopsis thaliana]VYS56644.1 unnamed protein product [Arabidopsis thaliana]